MGVYEYTPASMSCEGNNRGKREAPTRTVARDKNTLHAKQRPKLTRSCGCRSILKHHNLNHHYDYYRTIKIIPGILTMVYSAVNHSYDSKRTVIKIISFSGIITIIYSSNNPIGLIKSSLES